MNNNQESNKYEDRLTNRQEESTQKGESYRGKELEEN